MIRRFSYVLILLASSAAATASAGESAGDPRWGVDGIVGAPHGLGVTVSHVPVAGLSTGIGLATSGATLSAVADVTLRMRSLYDEATSGGWSPSVSFHSTYLRTTGVLEEIIRSNGLELEIAGVGVLAAGATAGVDYISDDGLHVQLGVGRLWQVGTSRIPEVDEPDDREAIILSGWSTFAAVLSVGRRF